MIYAGLMLIALAALVADWLHAPIRPWLFLAALIATAVSFALDITTPLTISL
jgi:hypothetical protein